MGKRLLFALFLVLCINGLTGAAQAESDYAITNVSNRSTISLNGEWHIIIDPYETGFYEKRSHHRGFQNNHKPRNKSALIEYDFDLGPTLNVPGDWNSQMEKLFFYEGTVWYKKTFDYSRSPDKRVFVYFGAANYDAIAYLNGQRLGRHVGGFTPFSFEVTDLLKDKENHLIVKVDNKRYPEAVPTLDTDWWNYGGLTRQVLLVEVPKTYINDTFVQLKKDSLNKIVGWVQLDGAQSKQKITIKIPEAGIEDTCRTDSKGKAKFQFDADLELWSPENPKLYDVIVTCDTDQLADKIGFRSIQTDGDEILLNGKSLFLRGISIHEESPRREGRATGADDAAVTLGWAKELGCNFVRLAHYPHNEFMLRKADELGLLVWSEIPVYWSILWENKETYQNAENQLTEMIARDKNRASIIIWSVANETPAVSARLKFLKRLIKKTHQLDPTRLVSAALLHTSEKTSDNIIMRIDDGIGKYLDVIGCNEYYGWYGGKPEDCKLLTWKTKYDKPLIMSEFGGGAKYGYHSDTETRWTEEYQENLYKHQLLMLKRIPFLRGTTPWILKDFRSPKRSLPRIQDYWNRKGLISEKGEKKKAFFVLQGFYNELANE